ncbi:CHAT domain-containing protein [Suillus tomentosus]|nr:CHAT domain-containing protein [Suillus tomentosus]
MQQVVITAIRATLRIDNSIRATDLLRGLRRIPSGFHVVVKTDGAECQTSNKPVHVDQTVVEWNEPILLSCELSSKVQISVYASFELGPMLCHGEVLGTFDGFVGELLDLSKRAQPIISQPEQEEVVPSCTSLFMTVEQYSDENDAKVLCPRTTLMSDDMHALLLRTDAGHNLLARYLPKEPGPRGNQPALTKALRELWDDIVCPVVENLAKFARRGSRIWWCLTSLFNFLPLHAAGEYRANGESLSQQNISSYTPSLTALMRARKSHDRSLSVPFVAIGQNHPLRNNTWLHFACHGTQKLDEPFNWAFLMRDQPLSLLDIAQVDLSRHQFAFLSACETAAGVFSTPDEAIHLAAGLQFAGVSSVVGTMWKVNDSTVQRLVEAFYKDLCGDGTMNSKRAAWALHQAVHSLAHDKEMLLDQRIVFMHVGV